MFSERCALTLWRVGCWSYGQQPFFFSLLTRRPIQWALAQGVKVEILTRQWTFDWGERKALLEKSSPVRTHNSESKDAPMLVVSISTVCCYQFSLFFIRISVFFRSNRRLLLRRPRRDRYCRSQPMHCSRPFRGFFYQQHRMRTPSTLDACRRYAGHVCRLHSCRGEAQEEENARSGIRTIELTCVRRPQWILTSPSSFNGDHGKSLNNTLALNFCLSSKRLFSR